ncbi:MAG: hypothetical protein ACRDPD_19890, partial [Streptosporangiaceae bacterium]
ILSNTVSGNQYSGPAAAGGTGILLFGGCGDPLVTHVSVALNRVINNDVGIYFGNFDPACSVSTSTRTGDVAIRNWVSDSAVTNTNGYSSSPSCAYQAGVQDQGGNHDVIAFNEISGKGYAHHPTCTTAQPYVTLPIDTTGSVDPLAYFNF